MERPTIVVIDYHKGNLSSVARGLTRAGAHAVISDDPAAMRAVDGLVLPGVGAFFDAAAFMAERGQAAALAEAARAGVPVLGICLGLQLLFERGDEGIPADAAPVAATDAAGSGLACGTVFAAGDGHVWTRGLALLPGSCTRLDGRRLKVPHVGWDQVHRTPAGATCPLLAHVPEGANLYFTHSYAVADDAPADAVAAVTHYTRSFPAVVARGSLFGCQFHPEKSSTIGLAILRNFVTIVRASAEGLADAAPGAAEVEVPATAATGAACAASGSASAVPSGMEAGA